jgi:putative two-component system response regulator
LAQYLSEHPEFERVLDAGEVSRVYQSAPLHDIGKVGVPDQILLKPGKLTDEEFAEMKRHVDYGRDAIHAAEKRLGSNSFLRTAREIAESHHEKWNGSGYPAGIRETAIPLNGRMMAIADVYDALISKRVYKAPFSHAKARAIILEGRATHFDPVLVDVFDRIHQDFYDVALEHADSEEERQALTGSYVVSEAAQG